MDTSRGKQPIMIEIVDSGATIRVAPETIRTRMHRSIIHQRIYTNYSEIAEELGYEAGDILAILADFGAISPRVEVAKGSIDFEFLSHTDTVEEIASKFNKYCDSTLVPLVEKIIEAVNKLDSPHDPDLTAGALPETVEKKG